MHAYNKRHCVAIFPATTPVAEIADEARAGGERTICWIANGFDATLIFAPGARQRGLSLALLHSFHFIGPCLLGNYFPTPKQTEIKRCLNEFLTDASAQEAVYDFLSAWLAPSLSCLHNADGARDYSSTFSA